jgi:hypothetical protein
MVSRHHESSCFLYCVFSGWLVVWVMDCGLAMLASGEAGSYH